MRSETELALVALVEALAVHHLHAYPAVLSEQAGAAMLAQLTRLERSMLPPARTPGQLRWRMRRPVRPAGARMPAWILHRQPHPARLRCRACGAPLTPRERRDAYCWNCLPF